MKAIWNEKVLAESNETIVVEGNHYFPADSLNEAYFEKSEKQTTCPWKGSASYYTLNVDGQKNQDAAWYYSETSHAARKIEGYVAFWKGVTVTA